MADNPHYCPGCAERGAELGSLRAANRALRLRIRTLEKLLGRVRPYARRESPRVDVLAASGREQTPW